MPWKNNLKFVTVFLLALFFHGMASSQTEEEIDKATREVDRPIRKEVQEEIWDIRKKPEIDIKEKEIVVTVVLVDYGNRKINVIRKIRDLTDLSLTEARDLVESVPCEIKTGVSKEEGENIKKELEKAGAKVKLKIMVTPSETGDKPRESSRKSKIPLKVSFDSNPADTGLKNQAKRYTRRSLKQLGDVVFTEKGYRYELAFFIFEPRTKTGEGSDIVILSVVVTEPLPDGRPLFVGETFKTCSRGDLQQVCELMVAQIDNELIEKERKKD